MFHEKPYDVNADHSIPKTETTEEKEQRFEHYRMFQQTFETASGKKVLEYFKKFTLDQPGWIRGESKDNAVFREGQNSIIREIIRTIELAKKEN